MQLRNMSKASRPHTKSEAIADAHFALSKVFAPTDNAEASCVFASMPRLNLRKYSAAPYMSVSCETNVPAPAISNQRTAEAARSIARP